MSFESLEEWWVKKKQKKTAISKLRILTVSKENLYQVKIKPITKNTYFWNCIKFKSVQTNWKDQNIWQVGSSQMQKQNKLSLDISLCYFTTEKNSPLLIWQWLVMKIWIFYDKRKTSKQWLDHSEGLKAPSKANIALKEDYVYGSWLQVLSITVFFNQNSRTKWRIIVMNWGKCIGSFAINNLHLSISRKFCNEPLAFEKENLAS